MPGRRNKLLSWIPRMGRRFITYAISSLVGMYYSAQTHGNRYRGGEIRFYDSATRRDRLVQTLGDLTLLFGFTVSPNRKTFLYSAEKGTTNDLMLVENFR